MQRAESQARRRNLLDLGAQDHITQLVYVHQLYFHGMSAPIWQWSHMALQVHHSSSVAGSFAIAAIRFGVSPGEEDHRPLTVAGAITLVKAGNVGYSAFHDDSSLPIIFSSFSISVL